MRQRSLVFCALIALFLISTSAMAEDTDDEDDNLPHQLVILGVSGLTSRAFSPANMPFLYNQASKHGAYTTKMRTVSSAYETPAWISILYGATPEEYGCESDSQCDLPSDVQGYRSLLDLLEYDYGYAISLFSEHNQDDPFSGVSPITEALRKQRTVSHYSGGTLDMLHRAQDERHLPQTDQRILFFHFTGADRMGHSMGYDGEMYHAEVQCIDWQLQMLCDALWEYEPERTTFVLVSEHGGSGYEHNNFDVHTIQVPFAMWGYGVKKGVNLDRKATTTPQIAPTIIYSLDMDVPEEWVHVPLHQVQGEDSCEHSEMEHYWNTTYDGNLCPVPQGWSHRQADRVNNFLICMTCLVYVGIGFTGLYHYRHAEGYPKSLRRRVQS